MPVSVDSAPYLAALVASSCRASATACAVAGSSIDGGPLGDHALAMVGVIGRHLLLDDLAQVGALPARRRQEVVRGGQRMDAALDGRDEILGGLARA